jgi:hypothetical protein
VRARVELWVGQRLVYTWRDVALGAGGMHLALGRDPTVDLIGYLTAARPFESARIEIRFFPEISSVEELIESSRTPP